MVTYKAMYKHLDNGVHGEVLDFPGVITWSGDLDETRRLLTGALADMAETAIVRGEPLPHPNPDITDHDAGMEEPIHLLLTAATRSTLVPQGTAA